MGRLGRKETIAFSCIDVHTRRNYAGRIGGNDEL